MDEDPWGLPYKLVLNRLRRSRPSLTETLELETLDRLFDSLFPEGPVHDPIEEWWNSEVPLIDCKVTVNEVSLAIRSGGDGEIFRLVRMEFP